MSFVRNTSSMWRQEVPGARWFKADLHIHTIDDLPGKRVKLPSDVPLLDSSEAMVDYARLFLQGAVLNQVQVLGLTPHSPRCDSLPNASAVWSIVNEWNEGVDDDGVPFREKIFAVFPGFEPSLKHGRDGLHLLFLFDPEIGLEQFTKAFDLVMGGISPWDDAQLCMSQKTTDEAFKELRGFHRREAKRDEDGRVPWQYAILAPHIDSDKGLLHTQKAQVLRYFEHEEITGLELGDNKLPEDTLRNRSWLEGGMAKHLQAFFHGTDAYAIDEIGRRHTWLKLASPRIEALRQAFVSSDSRIRIGFQRNGDGAFEEITDPPDALLSGRSWLKSVTVSGGASFFGGIKNDEPRATRFDLSPDLTCFIGGSMTGKSTFADGLRVHTRANLPKDEQLKRHVEDRGKQGFLGGGPSRWRTWEKEGEKVLEELDEVGKSVAATAPPSISDDADSGQSANPAATHWEQLLDHLNDACEALRAWRAEIQATLIGLREDEARVRETVTQALAARGHNAADIQEFDGLSQRAAQLPKHKGLLEQLREELTTSEASFEDDLAEREKLVEQQRAAFDRVISMINEKFGGRIAVKRYNDGYAKEHLGKFLRSLAQKGVTRWWNGLEEGDRPAPRELIGHLGADSLGEVGMSGAVQATFRESVTRIKKRQLEAIRCPDRYVLQMALQEELRPLDQLSGGQRVSLLLSLLLETDDARPLIIDQPEDELDNRFLFDTVLPALKRLKGRRQIIVATHDANVVVNGDADQVIQLEATANHGWVARAGAIEDPNVRDAIIQTVCTSTVFT